ncbi:MAG: peptidoglycan-binding protein, partial [Candidatus Nomurabacteria bacterium]
VGTLTRKAISSVSCNGDVYTTMPIATTTIDYSKNVKTGVSFARTAGFTASTVSPNSASVKIGSFTVQAGAIGSDYVEISSVSTGLETAGYGLTNLSNLSLKLNGDTNVGIPFGNTTNSNTYTLPGLDVFPNKPVTFDIYADIGNAQTGSVKANMTIGYFLGNDKTHSITMTSTDGVNITSYGLSNSSLANPTLSSSSPVSQFVIGGTTMGIATFRLATAQAGTNATVRELNFTTTGQYAIESITVGGVTRGAMYPGVNTIPGLNIPINSNGTDVPVLVKFAGFQYSMTGGNLIQGIPNVGVTLTSITASDNSGKSITNTNPVSSNKMTLVASKPTVTMASGAGSSPLVLGAENKIGEFTVMADANGKMALSSIGFSLASTGITNVSFDQFRLANGNTPIIGASGSVSAGNTRIIKFNNPYEIAAGQSVTFSVYATVGGTLASPQGIPSVSTRLDANSLFWNDVIGGNTQYSGSGIYNFPTSSYTTSGSGAPVDTPTVSISASPTSITLGQSSSLSWQATGATSCYANSVNGGDLDWMGNPNCKSGSTGLTSGCVTVTPKVTSTYEILCSGAGKSVRGTATVNVTTPVQISLPTSNITIDGKHSLSMVSGEIKTRVWSSTGGSSWSSTYKFSGASCPQNLINGPISSSSGSDSFYANPTYAGCTVTVNYAVSNTAGIVNDSVIVNITQAPVTPVVSAPSVSLSASPTSITAGQSSTVTWTSSNVNYCTLTTGSFDDYGPGSAPFNGSKVVGPLTSTSTVTLTCPGKNGTTARQSLIIPVTPVAPVVSTPATATLSVSATTLNSGGSATVTWSAQNVSYCTLTTGSMNDYGPGSAPTSGTFDLGQVTSNKNISLSCNGFNGSVSKSATITVNQPIVLTPKITSLSVLSGMLKEGDTADINFSSENTNYCHLYMTPPNAPEMTLTEGYFSSKLVTTSSLATGSHKLVLYCWDKAGAAASQTTTFNVSPATIVASSPSSSPSTQTYSYSFEDTARIVLKIIVGFIPTDLKYDVNKDGKVDMLDSQAYLNATSIPDFITNKDKAYLVTRMIVGTLPVDLKYDINSDGKVDMLDSIMYLKMDAGLATTAPLSANTNLRQESEVLGASTSISCTDIPRNLHRGAESNSVKNLQSFLVSKGLLSDTPTGFYGDKTVEAVKDYQAMKGLPQTGMVYDFTRLAIKADSCK